MGYAKFFSRSHDAVICVYDDAGNVIETHEHAAISKSRSGRVFGSNGFRFLKSIGLRSYRRLSGALL